MAVVTLRVESDALADNPLGDPHVRKLPVIVPDDLAPGEAVPCLWYLAGFAGVGQKLLAHDPWEEGLEERLVRLRAEGRIGKLLVALPDAFTRWGGSQYIDSTAHGAYGRYLVDDLRRAVEARWAVRAHGIAGKSSGGYGALVHAMARPDVYRAVACHSGDMGFRLSLFGDLPHLMNAVREHGSVEAFAQAFAASGSKKDARWFAPVSMLALCAAYSPDPARPLGIALPFEVETGALDDAVLARWLEHDPLSWVERPQVQDNLRELRLLYVDCGARDEHHLQWGARALARRLRALAIPHRHEEFDGGHRSTSHRLDVSLPPLSAALWA